ncbi:MAG: hypothetical protein WBP45_04765 [Daejeonella sp.]
MKNIVPNIRLIYACGLIPLLGGLTIFLFWWGGKSLYAINLSFLEDLGLGWILISFMVAIIGLIVGIYNLFKFKKLHFKQTLFGMLFIPINIPVLNWILDKQTEIENRTYLKVINNSSKEITIKFFDKETNKIVGAIRNNQSIVDYYRPIFLGEYGSIPVYDSLKIIVTTNQTIDTIQLSEFYPGDCRKIYLDKKFEAKTTL